MPQVGLYERPDERSRFYVDPLDSELVLRSVTNVLSSTRSMPWLQGWAAKQAAEFMVDHMELLLQVLEEAGREASIGMVAGAAKQGRDLKAELGRYIHDVQEALILDASVPLMPSSIAGKAVYWEGEWIIITQEWVDQICLGFMQFVQDFDVVFELAEATVATPHVQLEADLWGGWAGTLDWIAYLRRLHGGCRAMGDTKTGKNLSLDVHEQLAAYLHTSEVWLDRMGNKTRMPRVDLAAVLHVRPPTDTTPGFDRGYKLLEQKADVAALRRFKRRLVSLIYDEERPKTTGRPLYPDMADGSQPPPRVLDVDLEGFNLYRNRLAAAGIVDLGQLAKLTPAEIMAIKGLGKKAPAAVAAVLAHYGVVAPEPDPAPEPLPKEELCR